MKDKNDKIFEIILTIIFSVLAILGLFAIADLGAESEASTDYRFEKIQDWGNNYVVYDKETGVQYFIFRGSMTMLVDHNGDPLIYRGE